MDQYWRLDAGSVPSVADGTLYNIYGSWNSPILAASPDPRAEQYGSTDLVRRDPATAAVKSRTSLHPLFTGVNSPPTIADGRIYVSSYARTFCCAPTADEILWQTPKLERISGPPVVRDESVYITAVDGPSDDNGSGSSDQQSVVLSLSAATGRVEWRYDVEASVRPTPAVTADAVFVNARDALHTIDVVTGDVRFTVEHPVETIQYETPVATTEAVYVIVREEERARLVSVGTQTGDVRWKRPVFGMGARQIPVVADSAVYIGADGGVSMLDARDGTPTAQYKDLDTAVARAGEVLFGTAGKTIFAVDAVSGDVLWSHQTEEVQVEDVSYSGIMGVTPLSDAVYVRAADALYAFGPA